MKQENKCDVKDRLESLTQNAARKDTELSMTINITLLIIITLEQASIFG